MIKTKDVPALTAKEDVEFALFTKGNKRLIIRGHDSAVPTKADYLKQLANDGWKWSAHTHLGVDETSLWSSSGDMKVMSLFEQERSVIYNSKGEFRLFFKELK